MEALGLSQSVFFADLFPKGLSLEFIALDALLIGLPILFWKWTKESVREKLSLHFSKETITHALILAVLLIVVGTATAFLASFWMGNDLEKVAQALEGWKSAPLLLAYLIVVRPFAEEVFFRAFLVPLTGVPISALFFGLAHYGYGSVVQIAGAFVLGLVLAFWFQKRKNLSENWVAHMAYNAFAALSLA